MNIYSILQRWCPMSSFPNEVQTNIDNIIKSQLPHEALEMHCLYGDNST